MPKTSAILCSFAIACLVTGSWRKSSAVATASAQENPAKSDPAAKMVHAEMRNVMCHFNDKIAAHIRTLSGELEPVGGKDMPVFDDKNSFSLRIANAEIAVNTSSLTNALNYYVFASPKSPLKDVTMTIAQGN